MLLFVITDFENLILDFLAVSTKPEFLKNYKKSLDLIEIDFLDKKMFVIQWKLRDSVTFDSIIQKKRMCIFFFYFFWEVFLYECNEISCCQKYHYFQNALGDLSKAWSSQRKAEKTIQSLYFSNQVTTTLPENCIICCGTWVYSRMILGSLMWL